MRNRILASVISLGLSMLSADIAANDGPDGNSPRQRLGIVGTGTEAGDSEQNNELELA